MTALHDSAPAKINLCLYVGPTRADGRHELVTVFQPIGLADEVELEPAGLGSAVDRVICPGVEGENLAAVALRRFRARTVFHPVPNVDSVLVVLNRTGPAAPPALRALVRAAFAHRRKALARSLALAPGYGPDVRDRAREALQELGHPADERAERLSPEEFRALAEALR